MVKNQAERVAYHGLGCWQDEQGEDGEIEGEDYCGSLIWGFATAKHEHLVRFVEFHL